MSRPPVARIVARMPPLPAIPPVLDYAGVAVFALTGALAAARDRHDIVTFWFFAVVTGVGGGTVRDLLIGAPVFWIADPAYLGIGLLAAIAVWFFADHIERRAALTWLDAAGLAIYAVIGAGKALAFGVNPFVAVAMGVITGCFGGVLRDVLAERASVLLRREIYVSGALLAAGAFVGLALAGLQPLWAGIIGALAGFALRAASIRWRLALPGFGGGGEGTTDAR